MQPKCYNYQRLERLSKVQLQAVEEIVHMVSYPHRPYRKACVIKATRSLAETNKKHKSTRVQIVSITCGRTCNSNRMLKPQALRRFAKEEKPYRQVSRRNAVLG